ncbi:hypothetical protein NXF25_015160 [Crotalus adamanteus]|uniref:Uncharacterized protein n=1 Tax=Crotalus adamanteus TaxID=8729 RepID=A0AAW1AZM8_CROAD
MGGGGKGGREESLHEKETEEGLSAHPGIVRHWHWAKPALCFQATGYALTLCLVPILPCRFPPGSKFNPRLFICFCAMLSLPWQQASHWRIRAAEEPMRSQAVLLGSPGCNGLIMPKQSKKEKARVSKNTSVKNWLSFQEQGLEITCKGRPSNNRVHSAGRMP